MTQSSPGRTGDPGHASGDDLFRLRAARDAAVLAAQSALRDTTRLTRLLTILNEPGSLQLLLDRLLSTLSELFAAEIVILVDPAGNGSFSPLAAIGFPEDIIGQPLSEAEDGHVKTVMRTQTPILIADVRSNPIVDHQLLELDAKTAVWLPVIDSHIARGVLVLARCRPAPFTHTEAELLTAMAYRIGLALEQVQRSNQLEQIASASHEIGRHLDEATISTMAVRMFPALVRADAASLFLSDANGTFHCIAQIGFDLAFVSTWAQTFEHLFTDTELDHLDIYSTADLPADAHRFALELSCDFPIRALMAIPMRQEKRVYGMLCAARLSNIPFTPDTLKIAELYASQISAALKNATLYQALRASDERFRALIRSVSDVIAILTADGTIRYASPAVEVMWNSSVEALIGTSVFDQVAPDDLTPLRDHLAAVREQPSSTLTCAIRLRHGENRWRDYEVILTNLFNEVAVAGIVATFHDVTERKTYEQELTNLAFRDPLTGLANRAYFKDRLQHALDRANIERQSIAVVFIDLDNFKIVNDSLGHVVGDRVLRVVADRLRVGLRQQDLAARLGGDEFTVLFDDVISMVEITSMVDRLIKVIRDPIRLNDRELLVGGSMGIAISTPSLDTADDLLRKADLAMYAAKSNGKGCYAIFDAQLNAVAQERMELEIQLRQALERKELSVYYQPIVSLDNYCICGVEALVHWQHSQHGLVSPTRIISLAEETGLIIEVGQWVLTEACHQVRDWQRHYQSNPLLQLSVNLSARQLRHATLVDAVDTALRSSCLMPESLILEITESSLLIEPETMIARCHSLKDMGVRLAIDDFGSGHSSLGYLKEFPGDTLKIDRSFVQSIERDTRDKAIVQSIITLATLFKLNVIGEGIETRDQAAQLRSLGCNYGQGYLFAPPVSAASLEDLLKKGTIPVI
jgi:diguanylate cyclase (GGDEF)-like protein/PAS domain S-box-containing protein